jgi:ribosomal protein L37AE/L43A
MRTCKRCGKNTNKGEEVFGIYWCDDCNTLMARNVESKAKYKKHIEGEY